MASTAPGGSVKAIDNLDALADKKDREKERYNMAQNIKKQRTYIASLKSLHEQEMAAQRKLYSKDREMFLLANKKASLFMGWLFCLDQFSN